MKKIFFLITSFVISLFIGFKSLCAPFDSQQDFNNKFNEVFGITTSNFDFNRYSNSKSYWEENPNKAAFAYIANNKVAFYIAKSDNATISISGNTITYSGRWNMYISPSTTYTDTFESGTKEYNGFNYWSNFEDFNSLPIDWDTVYYSANILPPDLDITYRELSSVPIVDVPLNVDLIAEPQNVYVEIGAVFFCPDEVDAYSDNGTYTYHTLDTFGFAMTIIDKEDLVLASNASSSYIHLALNEAWQDVYDRIPMTDITWYTDPNYSTNLVNNMKSRFENLRKVCCFYGNELRLFVRYFVINNNTQFVVGSWRVWYSKTPNSFTDQTPTWYQPYIPASGTSGTSTNTGSNTQQDPDVITIPPGTGDPTGIYYNPTTNITVGSNVPNYPDYPTIRSYNADNFLVQTMNYLDYLNNDESEKTLFGEFGKFLATVFVFIPGEIWTIIAVGFSLVIVVMFLKIL